MGQVEVVFAAIFPVVVQLSRKFILTSKMTERSKVLWSDYRGMLLPRNVRLQRLAKHYGRKRGNDVLIANNFINFRVGIPFLLFHSSA